MKRYSNKAKESFITKFDIFLFHKVTNNNKNLISLNDFNSFKIDNSIVKKYEQYWQLEEYEIIQGKTVKDIEEEIIKIKEKEKNIILELKKIYISEFGNTFPSVDFQKLVNQDVCDYCQMNIKEFNILKETGAIRKKHLTRGWDKLEIDRKYPNLEYTAKNTVMACYWCNNAKTDEFTYEEFKEIGLSIKSIWTKRLNDKENNINRIRIIAINFRKQIQLGKVWFVGCEDFPLGCCGNASERLRSIFLANGFKEIELICNKWKGNQSHAWLEYENYIIDITIDQFEEFADNPIFIIKKDKSKFHQSFSDM